MKILSLAAIVFTLSSGGLQFAHSSGLFFPPPPKIKKNIKKKKNKPQPTDKATPSPKHIQTQKTLKD